MRSRSCAKRQLAVGNLVSGPDSTEWTEVVSGLSLSSGATFATLYDGDLKDCQGILGHHSAALTLERYRKPVADRAAAASEELDARLSAKVVSIKRGT